MKKEKIRKGKCKYCGRKIDHTNIRCYICDSAWQEGQTAGREDMKERLKETFRTLKNLIS